MHVNDHSETAELGYSGTQTAKVVGISYRQLDYWARTELLRPSLQEASGSGSQRMYSFTDLVQLKVIKRLLDAGINPAFAVTTVLGHGSTAAAPAVAVTQVYTQRDGLSRLER